MKQMSTNAQIQANGGAWTYCTGCGKEFWRLTKKSAILAAGQHCSSTGHRWWAHGRRPESWPN